MDVSFFTNKPTPGISYLKSGEFKEITFGERMIQAKFFDQGVISVRSYLLDNLENTITAIFEERKLESIGVYSATNEADPYLNIFRRRHNYIRNGYNITYNTTTGIFIL